MTFNPVIWQALCYAIQHGFHAGYRALEDYADACDGTVKVTARGQSTTQNLYEFVPKPQGKY